MAEKVVREEVQDEPRETVVVDRDRSSHTGVVIAVIVLIIILLLIFFGGSLFGGGGSGGTDINVQTPTTSGQ
jgi:hypothetical protein